MAKVIDVRNSGGRLIVLGESLLLPRPPVDNGGFPDPDLTTIVSDQGAIRYNPQTKHVEYFDGKKWIAVGDQPYDVYGYWRGQSPADAEPIQRLKIPRTVRFPQGLIDSIASCRVAPTANVSLTIKRNDTVIGTIDYFVGRRYGLFTFPNDVDFPRNDYFSIFPPQPQDATLAGVTWTITGKELFDGAVDAFMDEGGYCIATGLVGHVIPKISIPGHGLTATGAVAMVVARIIPRFFGNGATSGVGIGRGLVKKDVAISGMSGSGFTHTVGGTITDAAGTRPFKLLGGSAKGFVHTLVGTIT